jgi:hypothetical protein
MSKNHQPRILYLGKLLLKIKCKIKILPNQKTSKTCNCSVLFNFGEWREGKEESLVREGQRDG